MAGRQLPQIIYQKHIGRISRRHSAQVLQSRLPGGIQGGALDGCHRLHAVSYGCPDHIIDVAVVKDIIGLSVIGAETEVVKETEILNSAPYGLHILGDGAVPGIHPHAASHLLQGFLRRPGFVAGVRTAAQIGGQHPSLHKGGVALEVQAVLLGCSDNIHHAVASMNHIQIIHDFRQPHNPLQLSQLLYLGRPKLGACMLQSGHSRHTAGYVNQLAHGKPLRSLMHIPHSLNAPYISNLMGICDDRGGSLGNHRLCKIPGCHHGTLNMLMGVYQTRNQVFSLSVHHFFRKLFLPAWLLILHMANEAVIYINAGRVNFPGNHIDQLYILYGQITFYLS